MSRQTTPDIMSSLMNGNTSLIDSEQESNKTIKQDTNKYCEQETGDLYKEKLESNKTIKLPKNKAIKQASNMDTTETKEKATFNLSLDILEALEDAWIKLKRQFKGERITKTAIVEMALEICIEELEERESESLLHKRLADLRTSIKPNDNSLT